MSRFGFSSTGRRRREARRAKADATRARTSLPPMLSLHRPSTAQSSKSFLSSATWACLRHTSRRRTLRAVPGFDGTCQPWALCDPHAHQPWAPCDHCLAGDKKGDGGAEAKQFNLNIGVISLDDVMRMRQAAERGMGRKSKGSGRRGEFHGGRDFDRTHLPWAPCDPHAHLPWAPCDPHSHQPWAPCDPCLAERGGDDSVRWREGSGDQPWALKTCHSE